MGGQGQRNLIWDCCSRVSLLCACAALGLVGGAANALPSGSPVGANCSGPNCVVPPPPPAPGGCRGPGCASSLPPPVVPRDEFVLSLPELSDRHNGNDSADGLLIDMSNLDQSASVDAGVTSGADQSSWGAIEVQNPNSYEGCVNEARKGQATKSSAPGACPAQRQQN